MMVVSSMRSDAGPHCLLFSIIYLQVEAGVQTREQGLEDNELTIDDPGHKTREMEEA